MSDEQRGDEEVLSEEDHLKNFFKEMVTIDRTIEPLREHMIALKANYVENKWLSRDQMSMVLKAYRAHKTDLDLEALQNMVDMVQKEINRV